MERDSKEGKALYRIWSSLTDEQRELLRPEFVLLAQYNPLRGSDEKRLSADNISSDITQETIAKRENTTSKRTALVDEEAKDTKKRIPDIVKSNKKVDYNCTVRLWHYASEEKMVFKVVPRTTRTHYIGGDYYRGQYYMKQEQEFDSGGDGISTISLESPIGKAIYGRKAGDIVEYTNLMGDIERFMIISVLE